MSLSHIWDDSVEDDLLESTQMFWSDIYSNQELSYMITPDCRIASGFEQRSFGVNGIDNCLDLLYTLQKSLSKADVNPEMQNLMLMKTGTQTRFYITGTYLDKPFTLCFALEWCNGIIIGIVIIKEETVAEGFLRDSLDYSFTASGTLGRRGSLCNDYSKHYFFMGGTLDPPYHLPMPPVKLATVVVTVLNCRNLRSRLKRLVPRKLNPQVVIEFNGRQQKTEVVKNSSCPVYSLGGGAGDQHRNPFVFEIPETLDERDPNACVKFLIEDVHGFGMISDRLSAVKVPLAAIKCAASTETPTKMTIPLEIRRRHFGIRETVGILPKNDNVRVSRPDDANVQDDGSNNDGDGTTMTILVSKTDDLKLWLLRELQVRDEVWEADVLAERENKEGRLRTESEDEALRTLKANESPNTRKNRTKPATDETNFSKLFPYFLWSLPKDKYDMVKDK